MTRRRRPERENTATLIALALIGAVLIIFACGSIALAWADKTQPEVVDVAIGAALGALSTYLVQRRPGDPTVTSGDMAMATIEADARRADDGPVGGAEALPPGAPGATIEM